jgi:hypothetical protein
MPPVRTPKPSSTDRRKRLAEKIERLGFRTMAPCPQCVESKSACVVKRNAAKCSCCTRKNIRCGGTFSDAEFDELEAKKTEVLRKKVEARARLTALAWEITAMQKEHEKLDKELDKILVRQDEMVDQEARALEELEDANEGDPNGQVALLSDELFSWVDLDGPLMQGFGGIPGQTQR